MAMAKIGVILGAVRFPIEYFVGKFPLESVAGVHALYLALKYLSIRAYGFLGDKADHYFPPEKTALLPRILIHGVVLSLHIMPLYVFSAALWGLDISQAKPALVWYAITNTLTGLPTRQLTLRERRKHFHRKGKTP